MVPRRDHSGQLIYYQIHQGPDCRPENRSVAFLISFSVRSHLSYSRRDGCRSSSQQPHNIFLVSKHLIRRSCCGNAECDDIVCRRQHFCRKYFISIAVKIRRSTRHHKIIFIYVMRYHSDAPNVDKKRCHTHTLLTPFRHHRVLLCSNRPEFMRATHSKRTNRSVCIRFCCLLSICTAKSKLMCTRSFGCVKHVYRLQSPQANYQMSFLIYLY